MEGVTPCGYQSRPRYEYRDATVSGTPWRLCGQEEATDMFKREPRFEYRAIYDADTVLDLARQAEAMKREMAKKDARIAALEKVLAGDHEIKPLSEDRLEEILEFEERFKMCGGAGDTASLDWSTQRALIDEAVLASRARALIGGGNAED
ncbi:hypothetical protein GB928_018310 [Shinella curvata]|uniref:Uncharacterized protein n=1 Tax=Shinella curvata TaxID=1817964 RepID=A0ABT8XHG5_9HYPH|nr:hypothetical protein [Shinella curvata]MCJ8053813.1 hypothetical protein [Shinella curvata]MDO6123145.1 hypothetical protein [Shinella curvata]